MSHITGKLILRNKTREGGREKDGRTERLREVGKGGGRREGGRESGKAGIIVCDGNGGVGAYGMMWVHNMEPERSRVTS